MENKKMNIVYKKVKDLIPYENNPRNNDEAVDYVAKSIEEFGFKVPIVVDSDNVIIAGHTRLKASKKLGLKEVPTIIADDLTEEQVKAFRLADNKAGEVATWDEQKLDLELAGIDLDMTQFGFDDEDEQGMQEKINIEDIDGLADIGEGREKFAIELGEANNYIVLEFDTEGEWERAQDVFNLQRVETRDKNANIRRHGIGRVIKGRKVFEMLEDKEDED